MKVMKELGGSTSRKEAAELVNEVIVIMKQSLAHEDKVMISGFGRFDTKGKVERMGRDPSTGNPVLIAARRVVRFKPSMILRRKLNGDERES